MGSNIDAKVMGISPMRKGGGLGVRAVASRRFAGQPVAKAILSVVFLLGVLVGGPSQGAELSNPHTRGIDEGLASGALPPPGAYFVLNNHWSAYGIYDSTGSATGASVDTLMEVPFVLWVPGIKLFGADYAAGFGQPFDYINLKLPGTTGPSSYGHWGLANTILKPVMLSWPLPEHFRALLGLTVYVDDASSSPAHPPSGGGVGSGNAFWTLQPDFALSWLTDGWNLSLSAHYAYNLEDGTTRYKTGDILAVDYTVAKTIGNWTVGLGAHQENQITRDSGPGAIAAGCAARRGCKLVNFGIGPLVGYRFGYLEILGEYNRDLIGENGAAGDLFNLRLVSPL